MVDTRVIKEAMHKDSCFGEFYSNQEQNNNGIIIVGSGCDVVTHHPQQLIL